MLNGIQGSIYHQRLARQLDISSAWVEMEPKCAQVSPSRGRLDGHGGMAHRNLVGCVDDTGHGICASSGA